MPLAIHPPEEAAYLLEEIVNFCGDQKSVNFYKKVVRLVTKNVIYRAIIEAKVSDDMSETIKSKAAHFTYLIKKYAKEQGVDLYSWIMPQTKMGNSLII